MGKKYSEMTEEEKREYNRAKQKRWYDRKTGKLPKYERIALTEEQKKERSREYNRKSIRKNIEKHKERCKQWAKKNREKHNQRCRKWYYENQERAKEISNKSAKKYQPKRKLHRQLNVSYFKKYEQNRRESLVTCYVKRLLRRNGFPKETITPELIEVQRLIIKTKRLTKNKLKEN